jgi:hypothetical protein
MKFTKNIYGKISIINMIIELKILKDSKSLKNSKVNKSNKIFHFN